MKYRGFEKISFDQFKKDIKDDRELYNNYQVPDRNSKYSAGYDFYLIENIIINPGETLKIPTGIKSYMQSNEVLFLIVRSSTGCKYNVRMMNQVGVVDKDYYNNKSNEGHLFVFLQNQSSEQFILNANTKYIQGVFTYYLLADNDNVEDERIGGFDSKNGGLI